MGADQLIAFILRRLLQGVIVMLVVGFIAFSLFNFVGDPVSLMLPPEATQADREQMRTLLGLDQPFYIQFGTFLNNAVHRADNKLMVKWVTVK